MQGNRGTIERVKGGNGEGSKVWQNVPKVYCLLERQSSYVRLCDKNVKEKITLAKEEGNQAEHQAQNQTPEIGSTDMNKCRFLFLTFKCHFDFKTLLQKKRLQLHT